MFRTAAYAALLGLIISGAATAQQPENPVDILGNIKSNWGAAGLEAWINERGSSEVVLGENIEFHFRAEVVGYLSIAYIDSSGTVAVIVPSVYDTSQLIVADIDQVYPSEAAGFQFRAVPPAGSETALIVLTDRPLKPSSIGEADMYGFLESQDSTGLLRRYAAAVNAMSDDGLVAVAPIRHMSTERSLAEAEAAGTVADVPAAETAAATEVEPPATAAEAAVAVAESGTKPSAVPVAEAVKETVPDMPAAAATVTPVVDLSTTTVAGADEPENTADIVAGEAADIVASADAVDAAEESGDTNVAEIVARVEQATTIPDVSIGVETPDIPDGGDIADATGISRVADKIEQATTVPDVAVEVNVPEVPGADDVADATGITNVVDAVDEATPIPEIPEAPKTPTTSEVLTAAGLPDATSVADLANVPDIPEVPTPPGIGDVVGIPDVPDVPDVPTAGDIIDLPDVPEVPDATDVVSLPDVPDVPDVTGNALGRVMSKVESVPTSGAELGVSARQYATATVSRKVFNMVLGGGGRSRSGPDGESPGVGGVMDEIQSDPGRLDEIAEENPGTIGALRLLSRSSDPDLELQLTLQDLETEMEKNSEVYYCTDVSDCNLIPAGKNACGHARKFVIYTATTTDVDALNATIRDFNSYDAVRRLAEGDVEAVCADEPAAPELVCERRSCAIAE